MKDESVRLGVESYLISRFSEIAPTYSAVPGTPQVFVKLPPCRECSSEVKPGEDLCWDCLSEEQEPEVVFDLTPGNLNYFSNTWVANTTLTINNSSILAVTSVT